MRRTNHRNLVNVGILSGRIPLISLVQFIAVAEHLNFRHAAKALGISQSSVSARVKALEDNLGVLLFERHARGVRLTDAGKPFSIRSLTSITRHSLRLWQSRERNCRAMCNGNLKNFSNAGGWSMAFYGFAASLATPSTWSLSAVSVAVSARAVGRGGWPKVPPCWLMKYCLNNPCVSGC